MKTIHLILIITLSIFLGMQILFLILLLYPEDNKLITVNFFVETPMDGIPEFIYNCKDKNIFDSSNCLTENLKEFWFYNVSQTGKQLSYDEIKSSGGVCSHSSQIYLKGGKYLGFYSEEIVIMTDDNSAHSLTILSNNEGYCILDQKLTPRCTSF